MGSLVSSVHNYVDDKIFYPPAKPTNKEIQSLNTNRSNLYQIRPGRRNENIAYVHVLPKIRKVDKFIIFSHGNSADIFGMFPYLIYIADTYGCDVVCYDYPGYGLSYDSTGRYSESGCYNSLSCVVDDVIERFIIKRNDIILVGQSLGTGVVVDYVSKQDTWTAPIVLISPYKTIVKVVTDSSFGGLVDKFLTKDKIGKLRCPIQIFHGKADDLIAVEHGMELFAMIRNKSIAPVWKDGADHNNILNFVTYDTVLSWDV